MDKTAEVIVASEGMDVRSILKAARAFGQFGQVSITGKS
jgi:hypothetical protein